MSPVSYISDRMVVAKLGKYKGITVNIILASGGHQLCRQEGIRHKSQMAVCG